MRGLRSIRIVFFNLALVFLVVPATVPSAKSQEMQSNTIDPILAEVLVRDILVAVNHANWTGNYTVLRDLASPNFSIVNDPLKLAAIFEPIRAQQLDLRPVLAVPAVFEKNIIVEPSNQLLLTGYFPTLPRHIRFELIFEPISKHWRLLGVGIAPSAPKAETASIEKREPIGTVDERTEISRAALQTTNGEISHPIAIPKKRPAGNSD